MRNIGCFHVRNVVMGLVAACKGMSPSYPPGQEDSSRERTESTAAASDILEAIRCRLPKNEMAISADSSRTSELRYEMDRLEEHAWASEERSLGS